MIFEKMLISTRWIRAFMPNLNKKYWMVSNIYDTQNKILISISMCSSSNWLKDVPDFRHGEPRPGFNPHNVLHSLDTQSFIRDSFCGTLRFDNPIFSLFWPKKVLFKAKIDIFLTFMLINFLVGMLQCTDFSNFFCPLQCEKEHPQFSILPWLPILPKNPVTTKTL